MDWLKQLLREKVGLDMNTIGQTVLTSTIQRRMQHLGLRSQADYARLLAESNAEWVELADSLLVLETWFFRDPEPFTVIAQFVTDLRQRCLQPSPVRVLSLPCATGEEPYSIAMVLLDAGVPPQAFQIAGVDINPRALEFARRGVFRKKSFRTPEQGSKNRYFQVEGENFVLSSSVKDCVSFEQGNLLDPGFLGNRPPFDFVFCRNLLIYFENSAQARALENLSGLLKHTGLLFLGPAEQPLALAHGFVSAGIPMAFACHKAPNTRLDRKSASAQSGGPDHHRAAGLETGKRPCMLTEQARQLAAAGKLDQAACLCSNHLQVHSTCAESYYVLGVIAELKGHSGAADSYRKALYLAPRHTEALRALERLARRNGDHALAAVLQQRALRKSINETPGPAAL